MTKNRVLNILIKSEDYVSGEEMSRSLGISRAAVNTAVKALRKEGYEIASSTNRGYLLTRSPDRLSLGEIMPWLPEGRAERVIFLDTVDSTNTFLKGEAVKNVPDGQIVVADEQTGGRGRFGREFLSPKGNGIYLSMLMRPSCAPADAASLTAWVAVAVCDAVENICGLRPGIKWINDIVVGGKKVCGILTELSLEGESGSIQYLVTGIGINVNQTPEDFPPGLRQIASSLAAETGRETDRGRLAGELIKRLDKMFEDWPWEHKKYLEAYRRDCAVPGNEVRILRNGKEIIAFAEGISDDFGLSVRFKDGRREVLKSGEVSVRGLYGYV